MGSIFTNARHTHQSKLANYRCASLALVGLLVLLTPAGLSASRCQIPEYKAMPIHEVQSIIRHREQRLVSQLRRPQLAYLAPHRMAFQLRHDSHFDRTGTLFDDGWRRSTGDQSEWSWRLDIEWDFSRLVFNPAELTLARLEAEIRRRSDNAVDLVTRLYFERLAVLTDLQTANTAQCSALRHRFLLIDSRLNAMMQSDGKVARKLEQNPVGPYTIENVR